MPDISSTSLICYINGACRACTEVLFYGGIITNFVLTALGSYVLRDSKLFVDDVASAVLNVTGKGGFYYGEFYATNAKNVELYCSADATLSSSNTCNSIGIYILFTLCIFILNVAKPHNPGILNLGS